MKKFLLGAAALTLLVSSCKKDDDSSGSGKQGTLTSGMWKITASTSVVEYPSPIGTQTVDLYAVLPACQSDNLFRFNTDGSVTTDQGATKCNSSDAQQTTSGNWTLNGDGSQLTMTGSGRTIVADVTTLSSSTLTLRYVSNENNIRATTTTTYAHQ